MEAGTYDAQIADYGIGTTKAGLAQVIVQFNVQNGSTSQRMTWYGSLKEGKAREITFAALKKMGFRGDMKDGVISGLRSLLGSLSSGALNEKEKVSVTVAIEPDQTGTPRARIRWVGDGGAPGKLDQNEGLAALKAMGLDVGEGGPLKEEEVPF